MLIGVRGNDVDLALLLHAIARPPALIIDCANCADPHRLFGLVDEEELSGAHVMNAEAIYRFRDTLLAVPGWMIRLHAEALHVTTIGALFSYGDKEEDAEVIESCWEIMREIGKGHDVFAAIDERSTAAAERYAEGVVEWDIPQQARGRWRTASWGSWRSMDAR